MVIRSINPADADTVVNLAVVANLFPPEESGILHHMMAEYFGSKQAEGHACVIIEDGGPVGVAYYEPATATDRTWYLTMIAVRAELQGKGYGAALMRHMEDELQASGQRVVLVETSGLPDFALTRQFYIKCGYEQEARIRDYYSAGDDMIVFRKVLNAS